MNRISDEKLEKLLADHYDSEPSVTLTFRGGNDRRAAVVPVTRYKRIAATAASIVLVTLLSVEIYFFFGNKTTPSMIPVTSPYSTAPSEQGRGYGTEADDGNAPDSTVSVTENDTVQQLRDSIYTPSEVSGNPPLAVEPAESKDTVKSSRNEEVKSSGATERKGGSKSPIPTEFPFSPDPTSVPATQAPTELPHVSPTVKPHEPPWEPEEPTDSGEDPPEPVVYPTQPEPKNYCYAYIWYDGGSLYCAIEDENGAVMGDPDLYSSQHLAEIVYTYGNGYVLARWSPNEHGVRPSSGYHKYTFVNEYGNTVFEDYVYTQGV